jgi:hypothetical protein
MAPSMGVLRDCLTPAGTLSDGMQVKGYDGQRLSTLIIVLIMRSLAEK